MNTIKNKLLLTLFFVAFFAVCFAQKSARPEITYKDGYNFYVANDLGRNGYFRQKPIAELMENMADSLDIEFVAAAGDIHHFNGVQSVSDPLWMTNYELIYSHPSLMIDWFAILGNHEYRGNTQAVLDYAQISRRWVMPARYYVQSIIPDADEVDDFSTANIYFIDTTPLAAGYHENPQKYPDIQQQDTTKQLRWLDEELSKSKADFNIVIGHHPIYVSEKKRKDDKELIAKLDPILRKHNVDIYIAGHSHTFQHLTKKGTTVNYVVNGSASLGREPMQRPDTKFCSSDEGFSVISVGKKTVKMTFVNYEGKPIYQFEVKR